jgi:HK97 gp10 family phage protein
MAADGITAKVRGLPDLRRALLSIPDKLRKRALRNALAAGAREVQKEARRLTPIMIGRSPYRTPGLLRKAISVRTSKIARRAGDVGVFVNVRPAKKGKRGAKSASDPFYWRFVEFGTAKMRGRGFLQSGARKLADALRVFTQKIGPQIQRLPPCLIGFSVHFRMNETVKVTAEFHASRHECEDCANRDDDEVLQHAYGDNQQ